MGIGRPLSTTAQSFSATLDEMFRMEGTPLELSVEQKKDQVRQQERSLEDLATRLRETEDRLKNLEAMQLNKHERPGQAYSSHNHHTHHHHQGAPAASGPAAAGAPAPSGQQREGGFEKRPGSSRGSGLAARGQ